MAHAHNLSESPLPPAATQIRLSMDWLQRNAQPCPGCGEPITKRAGGCLHMGHGDCGAGWFWCCYKKNEEAPGHTLFNCLSSMVTADNIDRQMEEGTFVQPPGAWTAPRLAALIERCLQPVDVSGGGGGGGGGGGADAAVASPDLSEVGELRVQLAIAHEQIASLRAKLHHRISQVEAARKAAHALSAALL